MGGDAGPCRIYEQNNDCMGRPKKVVLYFIIIKIIFVYNDIHIKM